MFDPDGRANEDWLSDMPDWFKDMWNATPWGTNSHWKAIDAGGSTGGDGGGFVATNHCVVFPKNRNEYKYSF